MKLHQLIASAAMAFCLGFIPSAFGANTNGLKAKDVRFMRTAAQGLIFEVQAGQLALTQSSDDQVKAFAQRMITDHSADLVTLQALAQIKGVTLPTAPDARLQRELARLGRLSGSAFDREYIGFEINDHRISLREYSGEVLIGFDFDVRGFAAERVPVLLAHLRLAYEVAVDIGLISTVPGGSAPATQPPA